MQHENLFRRIHEIKEKLSRMLEEDGPGCFEPQTDPHFLALLEEGLAAQKELDILVSGTYHNRPVELAYWKKKMQKFLDTDAEDFVEALRAEEDSKQ